MVWSSLVRHLIEPLGADLALVCSIGTNCSHAYGSLAQRAKHIWSRREPKDSDWGTLLSRRVMPHGQTGMEVSARTPDAQGKGGWGLTRGANGQVRHGSGGAILETHLQLLEHLTASGARQRYEWFIVTRSDMYFMCDHPPVATWAPDAITVPSADILHSDVGGRDTSDQYVHDEFALVPRRYIDMYLTTAHTALRETARRGALWCGEPTDEDHFSTRDDHYCATERMLGGHLERGHVSVLRRPLPLVLVRGADGAGHMNVGAEELPSRVHDDLRCVRVAFSAQYHPAVAACMAAQGRAATAFRVLTHLHGADVLSVGALLAVVLLYAMAAICVCMMRRRQ